MKKSRKILVGILLIISFGIWLAGIGFLLSLTDGADLDESKLPMTSSVTIFDNMGEQMDHIGYVSIDDISPYLKNAFIAVEDKRFYRHNGIDVCRLLGAMAQNVKKRKITQGGSTISNQLVKNTQLSGERTLKRKIKEAKITIELEKKYDKDEILEMYLNVIYFGKGLYGVSDACRVLFGVSPKEVSPQQAASLAATVANPSLYSPIVDKEKNTERARMILRLMREQNYLSASEYERASSADIILNYDKININYDNIYNNSALFEAKGILSGRKINHHKEIKIYTYFDKNAQSAARNALSFYPDCGDDTREIIIAENDQRGIVAYASTSSLSYQTKSQPGSLLKPFLYTKAIERGDILPDTPLFGKSKDHSGYKPQNYGNATYEWITAREALAKSVNTVAVDLLDEIGVDNGYEAIKNAGIPLDERDKNLALALGGTTFGSTVVEIAEGYLTLVNQGMQQKASFIRKIEDQNGKLIYSGERQVRRAFSKESTYLTLEMMKDCAKIGTAKQLRYLSYPIAAKTGTVSAGEGNSDAWCAAVTSKNTFICRYSAPCDHLYDNGMTGGNLPTKTVRAAMKELYESEAPKDFPRPPLIKEVEIDKTIKEAFHLLVPYKDTGYGEVETILGTYNYVFDAHDPEKLLIGDIKAERIEDYFSVSFQPFAGIEYDVILNGAKCKEYGGVYRTEKPSFPIGKLEIICKKQEKTIWKTTRLVRTN